MTAKIKLNAASGGGSVSLEAPTSTPGNANVEFKLPVADGSSGQALTTNASGQLAFATVAGGKILQIISTTKTDTFSTSSTSSTFVAITGLSVAITPSSSSSKIYIVTSVNVGTRGDSQAMLKLQRGSTDICIGDAAGSRTRATWEAHTGGTNNGIDNFSMNFLDSPSTTSSTTYQVYMRVTGNTHYINRTNSDDDADWQSRVPSTITVMEVGA